MEQPDATENKFRRLAITHAAMVAADASMVVALADSFFFDVDPNAARSRILSFLLISFAPFVIVAPFIGPMIDRVRGGRRAVVQGVAILRIVVQLAMVWFIDGLGLFPLVFVALVLQKTYTVSKQALVPAAVDDERQLVEANAKLGVIAGLAGTVAVVPASALQVVLGSRATLVFSAALFGVALWSAFALPAGSGAPDGSDTEEVLPASHRIEVSWAAMFVLRALSGYMLFYLAFWFRNGGARGQVFLGAAIAASAVGTMVGNALSPRLARRLGEETMMVVAFAVPAIAGLSALVLAGPVLAAVVAFCVNLGGAIGRLSFESVVQRDGSHHGRGRAFAKFETRFQLGWVIAALIPVLLEIPASTGLILVGVVSLAAMAMYLIEVRIGRRRATSAPVRAIVPVPPTHSA